MAYRRRFSGSRPRTSTRRFPLRWAGTLDTATTAVAAATLASQAIIVPADYQQGTAMEASACTLMRIRGTINLQNGVTVPNLVTLAIYVAHGDLGVRNPTLYDQILRYGGTLWQYQVLLPGTAFSDFIERIEVDIKSKRKLENQSVALALIATGGFEFATTLRALMKAT